VVFVAVFVAVFALVWPRPGAAENPSTGRLAVKLLEQRRPFVRKGATIQGDLDLSNHEITQPFECVDCHFTGQLRAEDAIFDRTVDLSGSKFDHGLDMQRATFAGPAVFGSLSGKPAVFLKAADFSLATFKDLAGFQGVTFGGAARFALARFRGDALFTDASFDGDADFESATFDGAARFDAGGARPSFFLETTTFDRSSFAGAVDFRNQLFCSDASFRTVDFGARAEFSNAKFNYAVDFREAHFATDGIFRSAEFFGVKSLRSANFDHVVAVGSLDFSAATVARELDLYPQMSAGSLVLTDVDFVRSPGVAVCTGLKRLKKLHRLVQKHRHPQSARPIKRKHKGKKGKRSHPVLVHIDGLRSSGFSMELAAIDQHIVRAQREEAVGLIESSAKARGDLSLANDAHYRLETLKSAHYSLPVHVLDVVFYRWTAGYLVRPIHPLLALLALALLVSFLHVHFPARRRRLLSLRVRLFPSRWRLVATRLVPGLVGHVRALLEPGAIEAGRTALWGRFCRYAHEFLDALTLMWPGSGASRAGRRIEAAAYRVLFVCMLIGFANSNPTLRQMLDALL